MAQRFIVIGTSAASIAFITKLRSFDKTSEIICLSADKALPYNRCFLADFIAGTKSQTELFLKADDFFKQNNIQLRLNTTVTQIDAPYNRIFINDESLNYDILFLGIGSKPFIPNIGYDTCLQNISTFYTLSDAQKIISFCKERNSKTALVIGGGINGVECAWALHQAGISVGIIERAHQLFPQQLTKVTATYIAQQAQRAGIATFFNSSVTGLCNKEKTALGVKLSKGSKIFADAIIFATGVQTNAELLKNSGIATKDGSILVNANLQTNIKNIYAAGDICLVQDLVSKQWVKSCTWSDAMLQGLCAATGFSEQPRFYAGYIGLRDSHFFGQAFYACGKTDGDHADETITKETDKSLHQFFIKDNQLIGFMLYGDTLNVALYKSWYLTGQKVTNQNFI